MVILDTCEICSVTADADVAETVGSPADLATWPTKPGEWGTIMKLGKKWPAWLIPALALGGGSILIYGGITMMERRGRGKPVQQAKQVKK